MKGKDFDSLMKDVILDDINRLTSPDIDIAWNNISKQLKIKNRSISRKRLIALSIIVLLISVGVLSSSFNQATAIRNNIISMFIITDNEKSTVDTIIKSNNNEINVDKNETQILNKPSNLNEIKQQIPQIFKVPEVLPYGYKLKEAEILSNTQIMLIYEAGDKIIRINQDYIKGEAAINENYAPEVVLSEVNIKGSKGTLAESPMGLSILKYMDHSIRISISGDIESQKLLEIANEL